jgi:hypothetical protein
MESTRSKVVYVVYSRIDKIYPSNFVHFVGSHESIYLGTELDLEEGDLIKISFERVNNANT